MSNGYYHMIYDDKLPGPGKEETYATSNVVKITEIIKTVKKLLVFAIINLFFFIVSSWNYAYV